jgi:hypothetical protein
MVARKPTPLPIDIFDIKDTKLMVTHRSLQDLLDQFPTSLLALYEVHQHALNTIKQINLCPQLIREFVLLGGNLPVD